jgi:hypothetical protein
MDKVKFNSKLGKTKKHSLNGIYTGSLSNFDLGDWLENVLGIPTNPRDIAQVLDGLTVDKIWEYIVDPEAAHGGLGSVFKIFGGIGGKIFTAIPIVSTILDYNMETEKNGKSKEGEAKTKLEVGAHTITNLGIDLLTGDGGLIFAGAVAFGENYVNSKIDKGVDDVFTLGHFIKDNITKSISNAFRPGSMNWMNENDNQRAGDFFSKIWEKIIGQDK